MNLAPSHNIDSPPWVRYAVPFLVFMLLTEAGRWFSGTFIFTLYAAKSFLTAFLIWYFFRSRKEEITGTPDFKAVVLGLGVALVWIAFFHLLRPETEATYNPLRFESSVNRAAAIAVRIAGASLVVPLMEELFWRSFVMRYVIQSDFLKVPVGQYTHKSFWLTIAAFIFVHRFWEWPGTFVAGVAYGGYLVKTRNLWGCIIAHGTTNLALGIYIAVTGEFRLW